MKTNLQIVAGQPLQPTLTLAGLPPSPRFVCQQCIARNRLSEV